MFRQTSIQISVLVCLNANISKDNMKCKNSVFRSRNCLLLKEYEGKLLRNKYLLKFYKLQRIRHRMTCGPSSFIIYN